MDRGGADAGADFWSRLFMFFGATLYSVIAVFVFDAIKSPSRKAQIPLEA